MKEKVIEIIAVVLECKPETLDENSGLGRHYKWDSLGHVGIMVALEEHFPIHIDESNIEQLLTINQIFDYLEQHVSH
ncbi:acyl carrier protein [Runella defluvii]|uniref:Acyl carrier protein n=1 Tax=Runella defluvii TaxID=370973 RepID=A0A7W6EST9_9BACT|nr:acyl carrier protein [Runella defluvii]MBB3841064.1 acyl carrier protein [Runella defluvii]